MTFKSSILIFLALMVSGFAVFIAARNGVYPVALVNSQIISARDLEKDYNAALRYFHNAILTYGSDPAILEKEDSKKEIRRATLNKLVTDILISQEAEKRLGRELSDVTEKIISQNLNSQNLEKAVSEIYGLGLEDFKKQILVSQAHREILEGKMFANKENFDQWLADASGKARVVILLPDFSWDGKQVVVK